MNPVAILSGLALVACARAAPAPDQQHNWLDARPAYQDDSFPEEQYARAALVPDNDEEVEHLVPEHQIYSQFCIDSRDNTKLYLRDSANSAAASVFNILFNSLTNVADGVLEAQKEAIEEGAKNLTQVGLAQPQEADVEAQAEPEPERANESLIGSFRSAVRNVFHVIVKSAASEAYKQLETLKANLSAGTLKETVDQACQSVSYGLKGQLESDFELAKSGLARSASAKMRAQIIGTKLDQVECVTSRRIVKVANFCEVFRMAGRLMSPMLMMLEKA